MSAEYDATWVERFYDEYGDKEWDRLVKDPVSEVKLHVHRHYLEQYIRAGDRVLEIGPGGGRFTQILAELGARVVAADISSEQLALHRKHAAEEGFDRAVVDRLRLDMCEMGVFKDNTFDAVVCYGGPLSYVFDKDEQATREMLRVLRPGGTLLVSVMSLWGVVHEMLPGVLKIDPEVNERIVTTGDLCPQTYPDGTHHCHMFTVRQLRELLENCGAAVIALSASNCLTAAHGDQLDEARSDPTRWRQVLDLELRACREPGCVDMGTHTIAVARKPPPQKGRQS